MNFILKLILPSLLAITTPNIMVNGEPGSRLTDPVKVTKSVSAAENAYTTLGLAQKLDFSIFERAYKGMQNIQGVTRNVLAIVDFSKPSSAKRLFVIDMDRQKILFETFVAHGQGSGNLNATKFSNTTDSHQSSLGFYLTTNTYQGKHGYSLRLRGMEKSINDNAENRAIVMHGADYVSEAVIRNTGRLGRSWGCPAVAPALNKPIIDAIKGGSVLYIHANDAEYVKRSGII